MYDTSTVHVKYSGSIVHRAAGCQNALQGRVVDQIQTAMDEVLQAHRVTVQRYKSAQTETDTAYNSLNDDQKHIVDKVVSAVCTQDTPIHLKRGVARVT